jgi:site-specific DNA-methyltransferase (adenine-specific)
MTENVVLLNPDDITIDSSRYRKDLGDIVSLSESIKTLGKNIIPIAVTAADEPNKYQLVAGERRTKACKLANVQVRALVYSLDDIEHRIYEITENLERKDFDWREKVHATTDLMEMLKARYKKLPIRKASEKTGLSIGAISTDLGLAEALKIDPEMFARCKTRESALKVLQKYKLDENLSELALRKKKTNYGLKAQNYIFNGSCIDLIDSLPAQSISALITDPPYGIDLGARKKVTSEAAVAKESGIYDDDVEEYFVLMGALITKLERVMAKDACFCFFCDIRPRNIVFLQDKFREIGFDVDELPAFWFRTGSPGQTSNPSKNFARAYETFIYGTKGDYSLVRRGQPNVLPFPGVTSSEKVHIVEKPLPLMEELVSRFCLPGATVLDPFSGSATTIIAALKAGCKPVGFELDRINYDRSLLRVADFLSAKDAGLLDKIKRLGVE